MSERKFQQSIPDRRAIADQETGEQSIEQQKRTFSTRLDAIYKKLNVTEIPVDYTNVEFMVNASLVDSPQWVQMKLGLLREVIDDIATEEDIENIEKALSGWETYEMPLQDLMGELNSTLHGIAGNIRDLAKKYPDDPDLQEMMKLLSMK